MFKTTKKEMSFKEKFGLEVILSESELEICGGSGTESTNHGTTPPVTFSPGIGGF